VGVRLNAWAGVLAATVRAAAVSRVFMRKDIGVGKKGLVVYYPYCPIAIH
jgi:hypothetical protein